MALQFNPFLKSSNGLILGLYNGANGSSVGTLFNTSTTTFLRIYPSTVAYPSSPIENHSLLPGGSILSYNNLVFTVSGSSIIVTGGPLTANATAAGTLSWFSLSSSSASGDGSSMVIISDSVGPNGSDNILTLSNMTPGIGNSVSILSFTIKLV